MWNNATGGYTHLYIFHAAPQAETIDPSSRRRRSISYLSSASATSDYGWAIADTRSETTHGMDPRSPRLLQLRRSTYGLRAFLLSKNPNTNTRPTKAYYLDTLQHGMIPFIRKKMLRNQSPPTTQRRSTTHPTLWQEEVRLRNSGSSYPLPMSESMLARRVYLPGSRISETIIPPK